MFAGATGMPWPAGPTTPVGGIPGSGASVRGIPGAPRAARWQPPLGGPEWAVGGGSPIFGPTLAQALGVVGRGCQGRAPAPASAARGRLGAAEVGRGACWRWDGARVSRGGSGGPSQADLGDLEALDPARGRVLQTPGSPCAFTGPRLSAPRGAPAPGRAQSRSRRQRAREAGPLAPPSTGATSGSVPGTRRHANSS